MQESASRLQVIDRAVCVMRTLAGSDAPMRLRDVASAAELSPSTARRILASLCQHQLCEQTPEGTYRLGLGLFELGTRVEESLDIRTRSRATLKRLSETSHLTAFLCVQRDGRAIAIERVDGRYAFTLALTLGGSLPLHVGAASRALLAFMPEEEVKSLVQRHRPERFTEATITDIAEILADMRLTRKRGYAVSDEDVTPGVAAIGMPVFGHQGSEQPVAAISVAGLAPHVLGDRLQQRVTQLRDAATEISRELGYELGVRPSRAEMPTGAAA